MLKELVIVVHGVGSQRPGETVQDFARCYATRSGGSLCPEPKVYCLEDGDDTDDDVQTFSCHVHRITTPDNGEIITAEVYWADLSRVGPGIFGTLASFLSILFKLRHVPESTFREPQQQRCVSWLLCAAKATSALLIEPIIALNFLLLFLTIGYFLLEMNPLHHIHEFVPPFFLLLCGWLYFYFYRFTGKQSAVLIFLLLIAAVIAMAKVYFPDSVFTGWVDIIPIMGGGELQDLADADNKNVLYDYGVVVLSTLFIAWMMVTLTATAVVVLHAICWFSINKKTCQNYSAVRRSLAVTVFVTLLNVLLWGFTILVAWVIGIHYLGPRQNLEPKQINGDQKLSGGISDSLQSIPPGLNNFSEAALNAIGITWIGIVSLGLVFIIAAVRRDRWNKNRNADTPLPPRLILPTGAIALTYLWFLIWLTFPLSRIAETQKCCSLVVSFNEMLMQYSNSAAIGLSIVLVPTVVLLLPGIRMVLDVAIDIINHFSPDSAENRMKTRFQRVVSMFNDSEPFSRTVVIAHSQGSMVTIEALQERKASLPGDENVLVTMGSPLHSLYRHYFSNGINYASPSLAELAHIARWVNVYRADDFVGTKIDSAEVDEFIVKPRGHSGYWSDKEVLDLLHKEIFAGRKKNLAFAKSPTPQPVQDHQ